VCPVPGIVLFPDADLKILEVNNAYVEATGIEEIFLCGNSLPTVLKDKIDINVDSIESLRQSVAIVLEQGIAHKMQLISFNFYNKDNDNFELKYYQPENSPLFNNHKVEYIFHTLTDVTEKVLQFQFEEKNDAIAIAPTIKKNRVEQDYLSVTNKEEHLAAVSTAVFANAENLYNTKVNYETLINGTEDLMWSIDRNMSITAANRRYLEKMNLGNSNGEFLSLTRDEDVDSTAWRAFYQRGLNGETFTFKENVYNPATLTEEFTQFNFSPILNREYQVIGVACCGKNLTDDTQSLLTLESVWTELNKVMDYSPDVICTINSEGKFTNVSAAAEKLWGYSKESMIGIRYEDLVVKEDLEAARIAAEEIISGKVLTNIENNCIRKDGTLVPVIWSARWDEAEKVMYCVAKDGTEKKRAELEMNLLIRNTDESFILLDKDLKIKDFNMQFKTLYENLLKREVKKGNSILDYTTPERRPKLQELYKKVLEGNEESDEMSFYINEHSSKFYFLKYKPAINENGEIIGVFVTGKDITEVILARQQVEISEEKYRLLFHKSPIPKWVYDLDTLKILDVNETAIFLYGYTREEFLSMTINDLKPPKDSVKMHDTRENTKQQEGLIHFGVFTQIKKDKSRIKADVSGHKLSFMNRECMMIASNDVTEKERVLQKFKENEAKLLSAQKIAKLGYWQKTSNPDSLYWSAEVYNIWGVSSDSFDLTYESFFEAIHPDDKEAFAVEQAAALAGQVDLDHEHRIILPDGSVKWVHEKGKLVKDEEGKVIVFEGTVQDITDNKLAHEKLLLSEARHKGIVESQTNYVTRTDLDGKFTYVNHKLIKDFSWVYPDYQMIGNDSLLSVCEHHRPRVIKTVEKCFAQLNKVFQVEIDKLRKGGGIITTLWDFICLTDSTGKPTEIQCVGIDISDRKKAEEALKKSNTRYEYVSKATSDAIWDWDLETNVIYHGEGFKTLFGQDTRKAFNGIASMAKNLHPNDKDDVITNLKKTLEGNETLWEYEYRYLKSDGSFAYVLDKALIVRNATGKA
ncbi:MAG: PAS domain S-box protein, partial [Bacteroidota bacterium]|nr:PAS domain S-box protein [Bacteroidota bacterium]